MAQFELLKSSAFVLGDLWSRFVAERARKNDIALAEKRIFLGGSRHIGIEGTGAQDVLDYAPLILNGTRLEGLTVRARVEVMTENASTTVTPRIQDIDAATTLVSGTACSSTTWEEQELTITLPLASHRVRFQVVKSDANARVYAIGVIEIVSP
jgi:hypothetical protein